MAGNSCAHSIALVCCCSPIVLPIVAYWSSPPHTTHTPPQAWNDDLFGALKAAGGTAYSNYAVGYNNVDVDAATKHGIPVGNTPGVLTETTAELAAALTLAAARRVAEADVFMRGGQYKGWLPTLFVGQLLQGKTVGIIGAGRIGAAYARMMVEGHKMNLVYFDPYPNTFLEVCGGLRWVAGELGEGVFVQYIYAMYRSIRDGKTRELSG